MFGEGFLVLPTTRVRTSCHSAALPKLGGRIVGADEIDVNRNHIGWKSPLARALMQSGPGDRVVLHAPGRTEQLQVLEVRTSASRWSRSAHRPAQSPRP